jgi:hypothetical protein
MICILKYDTPLVANPSGWIIATDLDDARRRAKGAGEHDLASLLYTREFLPPTGIHELPVNPHGNPRYIMLVQ